MQFASGQVRRKNRTTTNLPLKRKLDEALHIKMIDDFIEPIRCEGEQED